MEMPPAPGGLLPSFAGAYSKDKKPRSFPTGTAPQPLPCCIYFLFIISVLCLAATLAGIAFSASNLRQPTRIITVFRCGCAEDSLRTHQSIDLGEEGLAARPKLLGFVGLQTGFSSADRRAALRSTWFPATPEGLMSLEQSTGLGFRFVIGRTKDAKRLADLKIEEKKYHDFMFIDVEEEYARLPYKTLAFFKAAFSLFDAEFYVKADDDIYLRPDRLATLLAKDRGHRRTYIGCMKKGRVITNPKFKWYERSGHLIGYEYFLHAYGPIYALSAEVVASFVGARNDSLRMFNNEDVTIGSWMLAMNVNHEDNQAICDPKCTPSSIMKITSAHPAPPPNPAKPPPPPRTSPPPPPRTSPPPRMSPRNQHYYSFFKFQTWNLWFWC